MPPKRASAWIEHVKAYSTEHGTLGPSRRIASILLTRLPPCGVTPSALWPLSVLVCVGVSYKQAMTDAKATYAKPDGEAAPSKKKKAKK